MKFNTIDVKDLQPDELQDYIDKGYSFIKTKYHPEASEIAKVEGAVVFSQFPGIAYATPIRLSAVIAVCKPEELVSP